MQNEYLQIYIINKCPAERKLVKILYKKSEREKEMRGRWNGGLHIKKNVKEKKEFWITQGDAKSVHNNS